ncbi:unnamed protein product [Porites lobata]|uniref:Uncharacterized protein n=1 Tax=Porites lobata TaxID=104759 RepID=A0ABN8RC20_9CNID|nr:unnamed protein product [Porites lobata]
MHTIYNKGDASDWGNYRRMLSVPSKILEALVCEGLDEFISDRGLLSPAITNYHVPVQVQDHCHNHENQNVSTVRVPLKHPLVTSSSHEKQDSHCLPGYAY